MTISFVSDRLTIFTALAQVVPVSDIFEEEDPLTLTTGTVRNNKLQFNKGALLERGAYSLWLVQMEFARANVGTYAVPGLLDAIRITVPSDTVADLRVPLLCTHLQSFVCKEPQW